MTKDQIKERVVYGQIRTPKEIGRIVRAYRKERGLTLERVSGLGNLSPRFLSEFERGKETAEIGKVLQALQTLGLEVHIQPRAGLIKQAMSNQSKGTSKGKDHD